MPTKPNELTDEQKAQQEALKQKAREEEEQKKRINAAAQVTPTPVTQTLTTDDPLKFQEIINLYNQAFLKDGKYLPSNAEPKVAPGPNNKDCLVLKFASKEEAENFFQDLASKNMAFIVYDASGKETYKSTGDGKLLAKNGDQWEPLQKNVTAAFKERLPRETQPEESSTPPPPAIPT